MTDHDRTDDLEWRLHSMLTSRADAVEPKLFGPALRARAESTRRRRVLVPTVISAGLVSAVAAAIVVAVVTTDAPTHHRPVPGGGGTAGTVVSTPVSTPATPLPSRTSSSPASTPSASVPTRVITGPIPVGPTTSNPVIPTRLSSMP